MSAADEFMECFDCRRRAKGARLCSACAHNSALIERLKAIQNVTFQCPAGTRIEAYGGSGGDMIRVIAPPRNEIKPAMRPVWNGKPPVEARPSVRHAIWTDPKNNRRFPVKILGEEKDGSMRVEGPYGCIWFVNADNLESADPSDIYGELPV